MNMDGVGKFLTITDIQDYLNISKASAYNLTHRKDFPVCRFGGSVRIPVEPFLSWVAQNTFIPKSLHEDGFSA